MKLLDPWSHGRCLLIYGDIITFYIETGHIFSKAPQCITDTTILSLEMTNPIFLGTFEALTVHPKK